jgi:hypothetical protein
MLRFVTAVIVFAVIIGSTATVLGLLDELEARRNQRRRVYVSKRCLRAFDPTPAAHELDELDGLELDEPYP